MAENDKLAREKTLREKAQDWLALREAEPLADVNPHLTRSEIADIITEYLRETEPGRLDYKKAYDTLQADYKALYEQRLEDGEELERLRAEKDKLAESLKIKIHENRDLRDDLQSMQTEKQILSGKVQAYEFVIRCHGISGADVDNSPF